jgi:hypothetical protein
LGHNQKQFYREAQNFIEFRSDIKVILMTAFDGKTTPFLIIARAMVLRADKIIQNSFCIEDIQIFWKQS